jgi:hypothetical protein
MHKEDRLETRVGEPGTARMTFRGPLLPSRRRAGEVPVSLAAYHGFAVIAAAHDIEGRYERALYPAGVALRDFAVMAEIAQRPGIGRPASPTTSGWAARGCPTICPYWRRRASSSGCSVSATFGAGGYGSVARAVTCWQMPVSGSPAATTTG